MRHDTGSKLYGSNNPSATEFVTCAMASSTCSASNFKTFLKQKKREYATQFPFLTESQIVAKLRRIWSTSINKPEFQGSVNSSLPQTVASTSSRNRKPRPIVRGSQSSLAGESSVTTKENCHTAHITQDIPSHSRSTTSGDSVRHELGSLPCGLHSSIGRLKFSPSSGSRCDLPQTTCTPHTLTTAHKSPLAQRTNISPGSSPFYANIGKAVQHSVSFDFTQSSSVNGSTTYLSDREAQRVSLTTVQNNSFTRSFRKRQIRPRRLTRRVENKEGEENANSEPEQSCHEVLLSETSLDSSTSSLPSDLSQFTSRLTRSKAALLKRQLLPGLISLREPPTKKRKTRDGGIGTNVSCSKSESVEKENSVADRLRTCVSESVGNESSKVKASSPYQPYIDCTTTPSPFTSKQPETSPSPVHQDVLCDMFLPLTPERQKYEFFKSIPSFYSTSTTERRRAFLSAAVVGGQREVLDYCMFDDDSDIFM